MAATEARREARFHGRALVRTAQTRARQRAARRWPVRPGCGPARHHARTVLGIVDNWPDARRVARPAAERRSRTHHEFASSPSLALRYARFARVYAVGIGGDLTQARAQRDIAAMRTHLDCRNRRAHGFGHLRKAQPTKPMQLDHFTLLRRERKERACWFSRGVGALLPARPFERLRDSIIVERSLVAPLAAPEVLALQIQSDRENPRFELTTRLEVQTAAVQMQKRLLDQVIGLFGATQITGHGTLQERSVALE